MKLTPEERQKYIAELATSIEEGQRLLHGKGRLTGPILMQAEGVDGQLLLLEDGIRIKRREKTEYLARGLKGDKVMPYSQISSIEFKRAGMLTNGYIQFLLLGEHKSREGISNATLDENTVMFRAAQQPVFDSIKTALETKIAAARTATAKATVPKVAPQTLSYIEQLERLSSLRDRGIITEDEFTAKKRQILGI